MRKYVRRNSYGHILPQHAVSRSRRDTVTSIPYDNYLDYDDCHLQGKEETVYKPVIYHCESSLYLQKCCKKGRIGC